MSIFTTVEEIHVYNEDGKICPGEPLILRTLEGRIMQFKMPRVNKNEWFTIEIPLNKQVIRTLPKRISLTIRNQITGNKRELEIMKVSYPKVRRPEPPK